MVEIKIRAERYGLTYPAEIQEPQKLKQQDVCNGEWWGAVFYGGSRCLAIMAPYEKEPELRMSFPRLIDGDCVDYPTTGVLGQRLWEVESDKAIVLDGYLAKEQDDETTWSRWEGRHLLPSTVFYVHDGIGRAAFDRGHGKQPFSKRRKRIVGPVARQTSDGRVRIVPYKHIKSKRDFAALKREAKADGAYIMLRRDAPHRAGKSGNLLIGKPK